MTASLPARCAGTPRRWTSPVARRPGIVLGWLGAITSFAAFVISGYHTYGSYLSVVLPLICSVCDRQSYHILYSTVYRGARSLHTTCTQHTCVHLIVHLARNNLHDFLPNALCRAKSAPSAKPGDEPPLNGNHPSGGSLGSPSSGSGTQRSAPRRQRQWRRWRGQGAVRGGVGGVGLGGRCGQRRRRGRRGRMRAGGRSWRSSVNWSAGTPLGMRSTNLRHAHAPGPSTARPCVATPSLCSLINQLSRVPRLTPHACETCKSYASLWRQRVPH